MFKRKGKAKKPSLTSTPGGEGRGHGGRGNFNIPPSSNALNKKIRPYKEPICSCSHNYGILGVGCICVFRTAGFIPECHFRNGESFSLVRSKIDEMRSKIKV
jgi:hypothetical protein